MWSRRSSRTIALARVGVCFAELNHRCGASAPDVCRLALGPVLCLNTGRTRERAGWSVCHPGCLAFLSFCDIGWATSRSDCSRRLVAQSRCELYKRSAGSLCCLPRNRSFLRCFLLEMPRTSKLRALIAVADGWVSEVGVGRFLRKLNARLHPPRRTRR